MTFPHLIGLIFHVADNLLGALLRIKEVIRRRVESSEEEDGDERGMTQRLEDILKDSSGEMLKCSPIYAAFYQTKLLLFYLSHSCLLI